MRKNFHQFIPSKSNVLWAIFASICPALFYSQFIAFACNAKSFAISIFLIYSSLQQIWTDWQKLLVEFFRFVKLHECGSVWALWKNFMWQIFISVWHFVCKSDVFACHTICKACPCALEKAVMAEVSGYIKVSGHVNTIKFFIM